MTPALLDVDCPWCGAGPLEPCSAGPGRYMEFSVHGARRIRAGVEFDAEPEPEPEPKTPKPRKPKTRTYSDVCSKGHAYTAANTYKHPNGTRRCRTCKANQASKGIRRQRTDVLHRNNGTYCRNGHEYTEANTYMHKETRRCRQCIRENRANAKKRASK